MAKRRPALERFMSKVNKSGGCWLWTGSRQKDGYGSFWNGCYLDGVPGRPVMVLAHRWSYEHFVGPIPEGECVCHRCDTPPCVNPAHLFAAPQRENVRDCIDKGRHAKGRRMLTPEEVAEVRSRYGGEYGDAVRLASAFGVSRRLILATVADLPRHGRLAVRRGTGRRNR